MLIVYNPMNNMTQHWENGNLLPKQMSRLIFYRYSAFSSTLSGVESGKVCIPQRANQWADILELLNSVAFPSSTPTWLNRIKVLSSFVEHKAWFISAVLLFTSPAFCILCLLPLWSPVHPSFTQCEASLKVPLLLLHLNIFLASSAVGKH